MAERKVIPSTLSGSTLTGLTDAKLNYRPHAVMPDVKVVKIGGQSVLDRGRAALYPILDEIVEARRLGIQMVLLSGGGTRARHIYSIASGSSCRPVSSRRSASTSRCRTRACSRCCSRATAAST